jgi:cysteinyl-tRNA synthetase
LTITPLRIPQIISFAVVMAFLAWPISGHSQTRDRDLLLTGPGLGEEMIPLARVPNYRNRMREMIEELSTYARRRDPAFSIVVRPGFELLRWDEREFILAEAKRGPGADIPEDMVTPMGLPMRRFIQAIDGIVLSNQFCGEGLPLTSLQRFQALGVEMMSIEHCGNDSAAVRALRQSRDALMVSHADSDLIDSFESIPVRRPIDENPDNVEAMSDARNMLVATATRPYGSRGDWLLAARSNNYDVLVVDAFFNGNEALTKEDVHSLKFKELGARRQVLAWLDLTHAADDRFYWESDWEVGTPSWIVGRHENRPGTFAVEYWHPRWKSIVGTYFAGLMDLGFDGVLLNGSDLYLRFEAMTPLEPL